MLKAAPGELRSGGRKPSWLRVRFPGGPNYLRIHRLIRQRGLHTVCREARCPNRGECWEAGTAAFLILGDICTRACRFCAVSTGRPLPPDPLEPLRVARAVRLMGLRHAVITSVNRDDLSDGGAVAFAETVRWVRRLSPRSTVEVLVPDFMGNWEALATVAATGPEILNHNLETVPRLYRRVRARARYDRSLELLRLAKELSPRTLTKSGLMVGLGEGEEELLTVMADLAAAGCDILTIGQYLQPTRKHLPVARFYRPEEFQRLAEVARSMGFRYVEAGPLVRSSYRAGRQTEGLGRAAPPPKG